MDIRKFGAYISKLRKSKDFTQSQLADLLNVTRQAISKWEMGDSFPDISLLPPLSEVFGVSVDQILNYGELSKNENRILLEVSKGTPEKVADMLQNGELQVGSIVNVAPILKASTLDIITKGLERHGIEINYIVELATFMNEEGLSNLLKLASLEKLDEEMLARFIPFLNKESKKMIFSKIIDGELSACLLLTMSPYLDPSLFCQVESAVLDGRLDMEIFDKIRNLYGVE